MTRRDGTGDDEALDREVDEALALANERAAPASPPEEDDGERDWASPALDLARGRTGRRTPPPGHRRATSAEHGDAMADQPPGRGRRTSGGDGDAGAGGLDAPGSPMPKARGVLWRQSPGDHTSPGTGADKRRAPAPESPDPHPEDGPGAPTTPRTWSAARATASAAPEAAGTPAPATVVRPLADALGEVLAEPLAALTDLPPFDTSAMDGWALAGPGPWRLLQGPGETGVLAGHGAPAPLPDGRAVRIATGARIPPGTTAVLRSEHGTGSGDGWLHAAPAHPVAMGQDIRNRGQECRSGDHLLPAGTPVTPAVLGLAAASGYDELVTVRAPRVEVLVLGDELLTEGRPRDGRIRDALGPMVGPWLRALGAEVVRTSRLADDADAVHAAVAGSTADVIVTTGGTAAGPVDHVHPTLRRLGAELLVDGVKVRPGHPMLLARLASGRHLVGLPGNPLAAVSGLLTLAEPLLRTLGARPGAESRRMPLAAAVRGHPADTRLVPVAFRRGAALPLRFSGPAMLRGIAAADGLAVVPPGGADLDDPAEVLPLPWSAGYGRTPAAPAGATAPGRSDDDDGIPTPEAPA
ncbi:molybdopterin molybdotransferase MoeA [Streptomyces sp. HD1123-B1]|uniref:molybdopterin molybdotransferase MoeA n=1 Tax=Streptomyces huangiella TaxID=3228804 RepID=UPI003D7F0045